MAYDIVTAIIDELVTIYTAQMLTGISDNLKLQLVEMAPLQEDVTAVAPYVVIGLKQDKGRILDPMHDNEVGMGLKWMNFFEIGGRIPAYTTKTEAYAAIGKLNSRAVKVIADYYSLNGITSDDGEAVFGATTELIDRNITRVYGGDNEWYGQFRIDVHFFSQAPKSASV